MCQLNKINHDRTKASLKRDLKMKTYAICLPIFDLISVLHVQTQELKKTVG